MRFYIIYSVILAEFQKHPTETHRASAESRGKLLILAFGAFGRPDETEIGGCPKVPLRHFVYYQKSPISANSRVVGLGAGKSRGENGPFYGPGRDLFYFSFHFEQLLFRFMGLVAI